MKNRKREFEQKNCHNFLLLLRQVKANYFDHNFVLSTRPFTILYKENYQKKVKQNLWFCLKFYICNQTLTEKKSRAGPKVAGYDYLKVQHPTGLGAINILSEINDTTIILSVYARPFPNCQQHPPSLMIRKLTPTTNIQLSIPSLGLQIFNFNPRVLGHQRMQVCQKYLLTFLPTIEGLKFLPADCLHPLVEVLTRNYHAILCRKSIKLSL